MRSPGLGKRVLGVLGLFAVVMTVYLLWARPYQLRWGATDEEVRRPIPGDELDPSPSFLATRAITIDGTPEAIWPWLMQMGFTRAGFYGYDIIENAGSPRRLQSATRILPEFQNFKVGDVVPISPVASMVFDAIEPFDYIIWTSDDAYGGFSWALYPVDETQTRLVSRIRWSHRWAQPGQLALDVFTEFTDHLAVRKVLQGVKGRVEGNFQPASDANIELLIYIGSALVFVWGALSVLRLPLTWGSWLVGLAAGLAWLVTWYAPVSIWTGLLLGFLVFWATRVEFRDAARARASKGD
jgi:hypothetical protein